MKRAGNLWPRVVAFENLVRAARQAQLGKRWREPVLAFNENLERELIVLQRQLLEGGWRPGPIASSGCWSPSAA